MDNVFTNDNLILCDVFFSTVFYMLSALLLAYLWSKICLRFITSRNQSVFARGRACLYTCGSEKGRLPLQASQQVTMLGCSAWWLRFLHGEHVMNAMKGHWTRFVFVLTHEHFIVLHNNMFMLLDKEPFYKEPFLKAHGNSTFINLPGLMSHHT